MTYVAAWSRAVAQLPPRALLGAFLLSVVVVAALFAPVLSPYDPTAEDLLNTLLPPVWQGGDWAHPLGTDVNGRDTLSQLLWGARVALYVAVLGAGGSMILGSALALLAGYAGGWIDWVICRALDAWMAFPPVVLSLILMIAFGVGINNVVLAIVLVGWTRYCRVVRSEVLLVRRRQYVAAARLYGFTHFQVATREVLPAVLPLIATLLALDMGIAVVVEATLSFVGKSVESNIPAWGVMVADARTSLHQAPWALLLPMLAVVATVFGFNLLGDGLRRVFDPRLRRRGH